MVNGFNQQVLDMPFIEKNSKTTVVPQPEKVVIFYPHIGEYGGIERNILGLSIEISRQGFTPLLICFYDLIDIKQYWPNLEVVVLNDHPNPFIKSRRLRNWLTKNKSQIKGLPLFFGNKAGFYAAILKLNSFVLHYTDPPSLVTLPEEKKTLKTIISIPRKSISTWLNKRGVQLSTVRITMTQRNANELEQLFNMPFEVLYQGGVPPVKTINKSPRLKNNKLRFFSICRHAATKNLDWILELALTLKKEKRFSELFQGIEINIAGMGPVRDSLKNKASLLGVNDIVQFPGFLTDEQIEEEYCKSDIVLVPAVQGYGLPVLESLYRQVPVVLNIESRISEILTNNPWVAITGNSVESFINETIKHIDRLRAFYPDENLLLGLPSEQSWAEQMGKKCKWWA